MIFMNEQRYFVLKKLHSLSGVVPIAGFLMFHLFENSKSVAGQAAFNETVTTIRSMPYLYILEIGLIAPIIFHAVLGIYIARTAKMNVGSYGFRANWMYWFQRASGYVLFFFIGYHLYNTRFAGIASDQMFQYLAGQYARPAIFAFYLLGILCAAFHMANGLWGFTYSWGLVTGQKSQDLVWKACMGLGLAVALIGVNALLGFSGHGVDLFQHEKTQITASAPAPAAAPAPVTN
jgi:succinate dehydrogenase/fumarate reductase cytochrome b subunit (b558 family)